MDSPGDLRYAQPRHRRAADHDDGRNARILRVFYDEVRIPVSNVVGEMGAGWSVAMSTLGFERGTGFLREQLELARYIEDRLRSASMVRLLPSRDGPGAGAACTR